MKLPIIVTLAYHSKDFEAAKSLVDWMLELNDEYRPHSILFIADSNIPRPDAQALMEKARPAFATANTLLVRVPEGNQSWPRGSNFMFNQAARHIDENFRWPFLWLEPDCIPLKKKWLDKLAYDYSKTPKRYFGCVVKQDKQPELPKEHLSGCAVYPNCAWSDFKPMELENAASAWDIVSAAKVVPAAANTPLIQCYYGTKELPPIFVAARGEQSPINHIAFDYIKPDSILFHRDKSQSLIPLLRDKLFGAKEEVTPPPPPAEPIPETL